jgi:hypothetical protein
MSRIEKGKIVTTLINGTYITFENKGDIFAIGQQNNNNNNDIYTRETVEKT